MSHREGNREEFLDYRERERSAWEDSMKILNGSAPSHVVIENHVTLVSKKILIVSLVVLMSGNQKLIAIIRTNFLK